MEENYERSSVVFHDDLAEQKPRLTLKLPSLKALKAQKPVKPVKLKPLSEVLTKLIAQIKKKDDYAFFLHPVNVAEVPGYSAVVKRPMDFGTMSNKVARGKYRSLEDFTSDLRLVTTNAKAFNPVGTMYHTEADKIEVWALDLIAKASATVIQYETDWNIDVENDAEVNVDGDDDMAVDVNEPGPSRRSQSVVSASGPSVRRSTRGPYKKTQQLDAKNTVAETIDTDGHLPGFKDGLGAFPPNSDLAKTMLALKLKGKKYKTKKERLRFEKEGPPFHGDGSLDYWEMEDPYTRLSALAPDPLTRPQVIPLYPPPFSQPDPYVSATPTPASHSPIGTVTFLSKPDVYVPPVPPDKKHWTITRNYTRPRKEEDRHVEKPERDLHPLDFGSLSVLSAELNDELRRRNATEDIVPDLLREQLDVEENYKKRKHSDEVTYFNSRRAAEAEMHLRDVVYGGIDGYAYIRSLAQFVKPRRHCPPLDDKLALGMPLAQWVDQNIVGPLTEGRHSVLKDAARLIEQASQSVKQEPNTSVKQEPGEPVSLLSHIHASEYIYPLIHLRNEKIDMGALIKHPDEVFHSENEWEGKKFNKAAIPGLPAAALIESSEELREVLEYVENALKGLVAHPPDTTSSEETEEMRRVRLNLLALVKRAPVQLLAAIPKELAHENIRNMIPVGE